MERQLVIFKLGKELFGIDIDVVEGIIKLQEIVRVPQAPPFVEGITNLRGSVVPVVDLEKRLDLKEHSRNGATRIVVVNMDGLKVGMIVAEVTEVLTIDAQVIEPKPALVSTIDTEFITGVAKVGEKLIILLDLGRVLTAGEKQQAVAFLAA